MILSDIGKMGVVGAGGGGFPTAVKLANRVDLLIMNAAECEPLIHKDIILLEKYTDIIISGFEKAMKLCGAARGIICIKKKHKSIISALKQKLPDAVSIAELDDFYPAGDEITLIYLTTGKIVQPGQLPVEAGAAVINVETVYNIALEQPVADKYLTVGGAVDKPRTLLAPVGTSYKDILSRFKITASSFVLRVGGIMMGATSDDMNGVVTKRTGGIIVLPADHPCAVTFARYYSTHNTERIGKAGCDQCTMCTDLCPRFLLGWPVRPDRAMRSMMFRCGDEASVNTGNEFCCECNLCTMYACPEGLDPKGAVLMEKRAVRSGAKEWTGLPAAPHSMGSFRRVPMNRLMQRLDLHRFSNIGPLDPDPFQPGRVRILMQQHAGSPAVPAVVSGQKVRRDDCIGNAQAGISAPVHASISGTVIEANKNEIIIQR